jgi:hypothetical protein
MESSLKRVEETWLDKAVKLNTGVIENILLSYFNRLNHESVNSNSLITDNEKEYFIKLFTTKLLECKNCCKKCPERVLTYRDIFHILYEIYDKDQSGDVDMTTECYIITHFIFQHNTHPNDFLTSGNFIF